jgi:hypothetical protein
MLITILMNCALKAAPSTTEAATSAGTYLNCYVDYDSNVLCYCLKAAPSTTEAATSAGTSLDGCMINSIVIYCAILFESRSNHH